MSAPLKLLISGHGRMGSAVAEAARARGHEVLGFVSRTCEGDFKTVHAGLEAGRADVVVDFTHASAIDSVVAGCLYAKVPLVTGTTGWQDREALVRKLVESGQGAMVHGANFSVGVNLYLKVVSLAATLFGAVGRHDVGIEERHHRGKSDAPSGTAHALAREILAKWPAKKSIVAGNKDGRLADDEISVASLRTGSEFGRHAVVFDGEDDVVELVHVARNRKGFATGAVQAAEWIAGKTGVFTFDEFVWSLVMQGLAERGGDGAEIMRKMG